MTNLILVVLTIVTNLIYYTADAADNGASLKASCVGGTMTLRVDTTDPFKGIIHTYNRSESGCSVLGRSGHQTFLKIDLTIPEGEEGSCGVRHNEISGERKVAVAVRSDQTIEQIQDRVFVVSCGRSGFQNSRNEISVVNLKVTVDGHEDLSVTTVVEGSPYKLRADIIDHDPTLDFSVRRCSAFDESGSSVQLIDDDGCSILDRVSQFTVNKKEGYAEAIIPSMFRLPHSDRTFFQCDITICRGNCDEVTCDGKSNSENSTGRKAGTTNPFRKPVADTVTASTSVFVAIPGSKASELAYKYLLGGSGTDDTDDTLITVCIVLGILFGVMLLINIFLCTAMTCSCTKSEIIEKEPSIYDDYSIYGSQYGYTNNVKQPYVSESEEYGSDFGSVEHSPPPHNATQQSRMNQQSIQRGSDIGSRATPPASVRR